MKGRILFVVLAGACVAKGAIAGNEFSGSNASAYKQTSAEPAAKTAPSNSTENNRKEKLLLKGLDGDRHSLEEWRGKVIVLNFWATWCSPCLYEIPDFVAYQEKYRIRGLQIIGVGLDEEKKLRNVQRTLGINYPILFADPKSDSGLMALWGNSSGIVPYSVVIDRDGRIAYTHHGLMNLDTFTESVLPLLDKT